MTQMPPGDRHLRAQIAAHRRWAYHTPDRAAATANARAAFLAGFEKKVDPDGVLSPEERTKRAENAIRAHFAALSLKAAQARRARAALQARAG